MENDIAQLDHAIELLYSLPGTKETFIQYQKDGNTEKMFKYTFDQFNTWKEHFFNLPITNESKESETANKLREEGNIFWKRKKLKEALEKYNKCILLAPHPKLYSEKIETDEYTSLAKGFGNRSALLFEVKEYENCICDIDRSLNLCSPKITEFKLKLNERKVKCLIFIERYEEAKTILKTCRIMLDTLDLEEKVKESKIQAFVKLLQHNDEVEHREESQNKKIISRYEDVKVATSVSFSSDDLMFAYNNPAPPSLDDEPNPTIPAFSCALKLRHSPEQGRFVVATRDIKPGEVLAVETAYTSCVKFDPKDPMSSFSFCSFCLARCAAPLPCHECTNVVFCNEECRSKGWTKFHMIECPAYPHLQILGENWFRDNFIKTYRIIAGQSLDELKIIVPKLKNEEHGSPLKRIFNEENICDSNSYRSIYFLEGIIKNMNNFRLFIFSVKACIMTQLLIRSNNFFRNDEGNHLFPDEKDVILIGSLCIYHICAVECNSYCLIETRVAANNKNSISAPKIVGSGTYIALSLFNHSCFPTATHSSYGNTLVVRSFRFIPAGNEVSLTYKEVYYTEPDRTIRRHYLRSNYAFICHCEACVGDYNLKYSDFNKFMKEFNDLTFMIRDRTRRMSRNVNESDESLFSELDVLLERNYSMFSQLYILGYDENACLELVKETIEFFDRFVEIPYQLYIHLSEMFKEIFDRKGSCYYIYG